MNQWKDIPGYPFYQMEDGGRVRTKGSCVEIQPILIGDQQGNLGFVLRRGMYTYLEPLHELHTSTWPEVHPETEKTEADAREERWEKFLASFDQKKRLAIINYGPKHPDHPDHLHEDCCK